MLNKEEGTLNEAQSHGKRGTRAQGFAGDLTLTRYTGGTEGEAHKVESGEETELMACDVLEFVMSQTQHSVVVCSAAPPAKAVCTRRSRLPHQGTSQLEQQQD